MRTKILNKKNPLDIKVIANLESSKCVVKFILCSPVSARFNKIKLVFEIFMYYFLPLLFANSTTQYSVF